MWLQGGYRCGYRVVTDVVTGWLRGGYRVVTRRPRASRGGGSWRRHPIYLRREGELEQQGRRRGVTAAHGRRGGEGGCEVGAEPRGGGGGSVCV